MQRKLILWAVLIICFVIVVVLYLDIDLRPTVRDFYADTFEEFLYHTKDDDFIVPDLGRYIWHEASFMICGNRDDRENSTKHMGFYIGGRVEPRGAFPHLVISAISSRKPEMQVNRSYKGVDIEIGSFGQAKAEKITHDGELWPAGSLSHIVSCRFYLGSYSYVIFGSGFLPPNEFTEGDIERILEESRVEIMEIAKSIIDKFDY